jgi:hypothetical protein
MKTKAGNADPMPACHAHGTSALLQSLLPYWLQLQTQSVMSACASRQMEFNFNIICNPVTSTSINICI